MIARDVRKERKVEQAWDMHETRREPTSGPRIINGCLVGLVLLSSTSLGVLSGYILTEWKQPSSNSGTIAVLRMLLFGGSLMIEPASLNKYASWRQDYPTTSSDSAISTVGNTNHQQEITP